MSYCLASSSKLESSSLRRCNSRATFRKLVMSESKCANVANVRAASKTAKHWIVYFNESKTNPFAFEELEPPQNFVEHLLMYYKYKICYYYIGMMSPSLIKHSRQISLESSTHHPQQKIHQTQRKWRSQIKKKLLIAFFILIFLSLTCTGSMATLRIAEHGEESSKLHCSWSWWCVSVKC